MFYWGRIEAVDPSAAIGLLLAWTFLAPICGAVLGLAVLIFWCAMIVKCIRSFNPDKGLWLAVILVTGPLGAGLYYFFAGRTRRREMIVAGIVIVFVALSCYGLFTANSTSGPPARPTVAFIPPPVLLPPTVPPPLLTLQALMTSVPLPATPAP